MLHRDQLVIGIAGVTLVVGLSAIGLAQPGQKKYPPQFPRQGATKLFENDKVIVWEQVGRPDPPLVHKHIRDIITIGLEPGSVETRDAEGKKTDGSLERQVMSQLIYPAKGTPNQIFYSKAGLGPHIEMMTDKSKPGRSIQIEIKGTEPGDCRDWSTGCN